MLSAFFVNFFFFFFYTRYKSLQGQCGEITVMGHIWTQFRNYSSISAIAILQLPPSSSFLQSRPYLQARTSLWLFEQMCIWLWALCIIDDHYLIHIKGWIYTLILLLDSKTLPTQELNIQILWWLGANRPGNAAVSVVTISIPVSIP